MDPLIGAALIGAGSSLFNGLLGFGGGIFGNFSNADEAEKMREHQIHMYKHRYQWATADMKKAGINPIYSVQGGSVAGSGTPSTPTMQNPVPKIDIFQAAIDTAIKLKEMQNSAKVAESQVAVNQATAKAQDAKAVLDRSNAIVADNQASAQQVELNYLNQEKQLELEQKRQDLIRQRDQHRISKAEFELRMEQINQTMYQTALTQMQGLKTAREAELIQTQRMREGVKWHMDMYDWETLPDPRWKKGVGMSKDVLGGISEVAGSALSFSQIYQLIRRLAR